MSNQIALVNIRFNDGVVKRLPRDKAEIQVELGRAVYISKTQYKAAKAGVKFDCQKSDAQIKERIRKAIQNQKRESSQSDEDQKPEKDKAPRSKNKRGKNSKGASNGSRTKKV